MRERTQIVFLQIFYAQKLFSRLLALAIYDSLHFLLFEVYLLIGLEKLVIALLSLSIE